MPEGLVGYNCMDRSDTASMSHALKSLGANHPSASETTIILSQQLPDFHKTPWSHQMYVMISSRQIFLFIMRNSITINLF